jgi:hypothetical protein
LCIELTVTILKSEYDVLIASAKRVIELDLVVSELRSEIILLKEEIKFLKNGKNSNSSHTSPPC